VLVSSSEERPTESQLFAGEREEDSSKEEAAREPGTRLGDAGPPFLVVLHSFPLSPLAIASLLSLHSSLSSTDQLPGAGVGTCTCLAGEGTPKEENDDEEEEEEEEEGSCVCACGGEERDGNENASVV
jgi:hypothetical protein